jgi:hypothetical protein
MQMRDAARRGQVGWLERIVTRQFLQSAARGQLSRGRDDPLARSHRRWQAEPGNARRKPDGISDPITDVQLPDIHDLLNDPDERWNLSEQTMDMAWVLRPVTEKIVAFRKSVARYPNVGSGGEFTGYQ